MSSAGGRGRKPPKLICPLCNEAVKKPRVVTEVFGVDTRLGGSCRCGSVYVIDETGGRGGEALLDVLTLACGGDSDRALELGPEDYELDKCPYRGLANTLGVRQTARKAKAWFVKLRDRA